MAFDASIADPPPTATMISHWCALKVSISLRMSDRRMLANLVESSGVSTLLFQDGFNFLDNISLSTVNQTGVR
jgi:hypothetical protein